MAGNPRKRFNGGVADVHMLVLQGENQRVAGVVMPNHAKRVGRHDADIFIVIAQRGAQGGNRRLADVCQAFQRGILKTDMARPDMPFRQRFHQERHDQTDVRLRQQAHDGFAHAPAFIAQHFHQNFGVFLLHGRRKLHDGLQTNFFVWIMQGIADFTGYHDPPPRF